MESKLETLQLHPADPLIFSETSPDCPEPRLPWGPTASASVNTMWLCKFQEATKSAHKFEDAERILWTATSVQEE